MSIETNVVSFGIDGNYSGAVEVGTTNGTDLYFKDANAGTLTLLELISNVAAHNIEDHGNMTSDFATQYYNSSRLSAALVDAVLGNTVGISGDVGGTTNLGSHVGNESIHQRVPKFVLRVAKGGQSYQTIGDALAAVPTSGSDAPAPDQWWRIEVAPGTYNESLVLDKQWVEIVGSGQETTVISYDNSATPGSYPLFVAVGDVVVADIGLVSANPGVGENIAVLVGPKTGTVTTTDNVTFRDCRIFGSGNYALWLSFNWLASFDSCVIEATSGTQVVVEGDGAFSNCILPGSVFRTSIECRSYITVFRCQSTGTLISLVNANATVSNCFSKTSVSAISVVEGGVGNSFSTIRWDGLGYDSTFGAATIGVGTILISRFGDSGLSTGQKVDINWFMDTDQSQRHLRGGHVGGDGVPTTTFGDGGADFEFYRSILWGGSNEGDVVSIGDYSGVAGSGTNSASALALYLGGDNATGKYLRWGVGDGYIDVEQGYIGHDGKVHAPGFVGDGSGLTAVPVGSHTHDASDITAGTLPNGRFPATLPASSGVNLTALNASNLGSGTVPNARFPATLPAASGVNLTALNATNLGSGTVADARLSSNVPLKNATNTFTSLQTFSGKIQMGGHAGFVLMPSGATSTAVSYTAAAFGSIVVCSYDGSASGGGAPYCSGITPGVGFTLSVTTAPSAGTNINWAVIQR